MRNRSIPLARPLERAQGKDRTPVPSADFASVRRRCKGRPHSGRHRSAIPTVPAPFLHSLSFRWSSIGTHLSSMLCIAGGRSLPRAVIFDSNQKASAQGASFWSAAALPLSHVAQVPKAAERAAALQNADAPLHPL